MQVRYGILTAWCLLLTFTVSAMAQDVPGLPQDAKVTASFATEKDKGLDRLFDGDPKTVMIGAPGSCVAEDKPVWINIKFAQPVTDLAGVQTGKSDPFANYYPKAMEFWGDSDGNGTFDTLLGATDALGPGDKSAGKHMFTGRLPKLFALQIRVTHQNCQGLKRSFQMDEVGLIRNAAAPELTATPTKNADKDSAQPSAADKKEPGAATPAQPLSIAADQSLVPGADKLPGKVLALPAGTKISASFGTDKNAGPDKLFDNDLSTFMMGAGGSCAREDQPNSVYLRFPQPVTDLAGVETGMSDAFKNYYPREMEFWADSTGNGRYDTKLGSTDKLGGGNDAIGRHLFTGRLAKVYGLEIRCVRQHVAGGKRAFSLNEMRLIVSDQVPLTQATPNSYRILYYSEKLPAGATIKASFATEDGKGPETLLDHDPSTYMQAKQGTAKKNVPASLFLRLPQPVTDLAGIRLGQSDPFNNYVWEVMQVWADTTGNGAYDTLAATLTGPAGGERRFNQILPKVFGLELRVTQQKLGGTFRAFALNEIDGLVFRDDPGDSQMRLVVEDFEDFSSWRTWAFNTNQPEGERYYGGYTYLAGALRPELAHDGQGVGLMRYCFKPGSDSYTMYATRGRVFDQEGLIDKITFWANPQGYPCTIHFEVFDAAGKKFTTPAVTVTGDQWKQYAVDLADIPQAVTMKYPCKLKHIFLKSKQSGTGDVLLDDLTLVGVFDRTKRVDITPHYEGIGYDPAQPLRPKYRLTNALDRKVEATLVAKLYSSFDAKRTAPLVTRTIPVSLEPYGRSLAAVDFGVQPYGHYDAEITLDAPGISAHCTDPLALLKLNGGRVNQSPMWFGSQHPAGWISHVENEFVMKNVVEPLGMDCYRCGNPAQDRGLLLPTNLLLAAGFGGMPPELRLPKQKNDDRGEPNDYDKYYQWCLKEAKEKYLPYADRILALEFYNEPDLPNFCYLPEIDTYLKMHRVFAKAFREVIPGVKIGTGGNTVQHGNDKKDFNPRMYTELAKEADVAEWHAHGPLDNYVSRHLMVENWLKQGGKSPDQMLLANSEAGIPSGESLTGQLQQADCLVKKIGWAKAQKSSYFYLWFTTTDTYDPQGGYLNNENWGLITYNQRLKASGQAYNELIKRLANTQPLGEVKWDSALQVCAYRRADGTQVWLGWPRERGAATLIRLAVSGPVVLSDMFGGSRTLTPVHGRILWEGNGYPFYIEAPKDVQVGAATMPKFISFPSIMGVPPGATLELPIHLTSAWDKDVALTLTLHNKEGQTLASTQTNVPKGQAVAVTLKYAMPAAQGYGTIGCGLRITSEPAGLVDETLPVTLVVAQKAVRAQEFKIDGTAKNIAGALPIVLDKQTDIRDLVSDPQTPNWAGPEDLSVRTTVAHDGKGLYLRFDVRDQTHKPGPASDKLWTGDSIQVAFYVGNAHTEIGLTETDGGFGWCWLAGDPARANKKLEAPVAVKRQGDHTIYEVYLPFEFLGIQYQPMLPLRMTFLINEDDGRGRVRIMKWFDGIAAGKSADLFGHLTLE